MKTLQDINESFIEELALSRHEPKWLRQERIQAWGQFQNQPDPDWRRSKVPKIQIQKSLLLNDDGDYENRTLKVEKKPPENCSGKLVLVNGEVARISLMPELALQGVIFCDMKTAVLERADLLEAFWIKTNTNDKFQSLQAALWKNGYFLFIPQGLKVDAPFQIQIIQSGQESVMNQQLIIMDKNSAATVEEVWETEPAGVQQEVLAHFNRTVIRAEAESKVRYYQLQNWDRNSYDFSSRNFIAKKNAHIKSLNTLLGGAAGSIASHGLLQETGAFIEHDGIAIGDGQQSFKVVATMRHEAEQAEGMMRYKGILKDRASSYLDGLIQVVPQGKKAHSRLEEHTLILGDKARCDALPALDIQTNDVNVSHAASVTKADQEKIFYAMSRGLSEEQARNIIIQGFFEDLLQMIQSPGWHEKIKEMIEAKLSLSKNDE